MGKDLRISVVIPARNERESLPAVLKELSTKNLHEVLVVDGHSSDGTPDVVRNAGFKVVAQDGRGYGAGVMTGMKIAAGDLVTFMDADGSYDPEAIPRMRALIENEGYDVVFCSRYLPESGSDDDTFIRLTGNMIFTTLMRVLFGVKLSDALFFYALARTDIYRSIKWEYPNFALCVEIPIKVHQAGYKYTEIPSRERPRIGGVSKVNAFTDGLSILWAMIKLRLRRR
jgi:glycosyltransferase involved in cell wall biosynthesis